MSELTSIKDILAKLFKEKEELNKGLDIISLREVWKELPNGIGSVSKPVTVRGNLLKVAVNYDYPLSELKLRENEIIEFLRKSGFDIDRIYFYYEGKR